MSAKILTKQTINNDAIAGEIATLNFSALADASDLIRGLRGKLSWLRFWAMDAANTR